MNLSVTFSALVWATAVWAYVALAATADLHSGALILFAFVCPLALLRRRLGFNLPNGLWLLLSLVAFSGALYMWFRLAERMYAVVYLFLYLEANKLLTARTNRDHLQVIGLTFFQMLAVAVSTSSLLFVILLVGYVLLIIAALTTFTIKRDAERTFAPFPHPPADPVAVRVTESDESFLDRLGRTKYLGGRLAAGLLLVTALVVIAGVALFFSVPRLATRQFFAGAGTGTLMRKSGFSDTVQFGGVGEIQNDPTIIMRVELDSRDGSAPFPFLRLRGTTLDYYTGTGWRTNSVGIDRRATGTETIRQIETVPESWGRAVSGTITLEPLESGHIFLVNRPVSFNWSGRDLVYRESTIDSTYSQVRPAHVPVRYTFSACPQASDSRASGTRKGATSPSEDGAPGLLRASAKTWDSLQTTLSLVAGASFGGATPQSEGRLERYRQLPDKTRDLTTVETMAREWTGALTNPMDVAGEVERRLKNEFTYSLDINFSSQPDHLTRFLRVERAGHCEYFATAMALMLRTRGIRARLVNGYLTDEWSPSGKSGVYIVRQEHAHSWVEVYIDSQTGWVTFDPTPDGGVGSGRIPSTFYRRWTRWIDSIKLKWYESFVDYSGDAQQQRLASMLRFTALAVRGDIFSFRNLTGGGTTSGRKTMGLILVAAGLLVVGYVAWLLLRTSLGRKLAPAAGQGGITPVQIREYLDLLRALERLRKRPGSQTPFEYAATVAQADTGFSQMVPLTQQYYLARFHDGPWGEEECRLAGELMRRAQERKSLGSS